MPAGPVLEATLYVMSGSDRGRVRRWITFTLVFYAAAIGAGIALALVQGQGLGIGDGRTTASCRSPGGPYFVSSAPRQLQCRR